MQGYCTQGLYTWPRSRHNVVPVSYLVSTSKLFTQLIIPIQRDNITRAIIIQIYSTLEKLLICPLLKKESNFIYVFLYLYRDH